MKAFKPKNFYQITAIIIFVVILLFTYIIAELDDAPGLIIIGTALNSLFCLILFGIGELIYVQKNK